MSRPYSLKGIVCLALFCSVISVGLVSANSSAGLTGTVIGAPGVEITDWALVLIDAEGSEHASSPLGEAGQYHIDQVEPGEYLLALKNNQEEYAPILSEPLVLTPATVLRRDIRIAQADRDPLMQDEADDESYEEELAKYSRLRIWWVGLSKGKKAATILGIIGGAGLAYAVLDDDDDPASPSEPPVPTLPESF